MMMQATPPESYKLDRSGWPSGPWDAEPFDRRDFEHAGHNCFVKRAGTTGAWCGYVGVKPGDAHFGKDYADVPFDAHGGLTYSAACDGSIYHTPREGEPEHLWWFGFDCAHSGDAIPVTPLGYADFGIWSGEYRTAEFAEAETRQLAEQIAGMDWKDGSDNATE